MMSETCASPESAWILQNFKTLLKLVTAPSDQIGPMEVDRIKGFSGHLFGIFEICILFVGLDKLADNLWPTAGSPDRK